MNQKNYNTFVELKKYVIIEITNIKKKIMKFLFELYYEKTKGYYPFFEFCPKQYREYFLQRRYQEALGKSINLHNPETFNEKTRWLLENEKLELKTKFADKIQAKEYVSKNIGEQYVAKLYGVWDKFSNIDFDSLPESFALKANHGWRMNAFIHNKEKALKKSYKNLKKTFDAWMDTNFEYASMEMQYRDIEHKIFAEELLIDNSKSVCGQFLIHCFNGKPKFIEVTPRYFSQVELSSTPVYDKEWNLQPFYFSPRTRLKEVENPLFLDELIYISEKLSKDFSYVRIDFLTYKNRFIFSEMTFSPYASMVKFTPEEYDNILGSMINI